MSNTEFLFVTPKWIKIQDLMLSKKTFCGTGSKDKQPVSLKKHGRGVLFGAGGVFGGSAWGSERQVDKRPTQNLCRCQRDLLMSFGSVEADKQEAAFSHPDMLRREKTAYCTYPPACITRFFRPSSPSPLHHYITHPKVMHYSSTFTHTVFLSLMNNRLTDKPTNFTNMH